jgi:hypothetical protein
MIELMAGDIILVRGRRLRHRMVQRLRGCFWNHAVIHYKYDYVMEVRSHGLMQRRFRRDYSKKQICVLRHESAQEEPREQAERFIWVMRGVWKANERFDFLAFIGELLRLPRLRRPGRVLCDDFVSKIYAGAEICDVDVRDIMMHDYSAEYLRQTYGLIKLYDYRGADKC